MKLARWPRQFWKAGRAWVNKPLLHCLYLREEGGTQIVALASAPRFVCVPACLRGRVGRGIVPVLVATGRMTGIPSAVTAGTTSTDVRVPRVTIVFGGRPTSVCVTAWIA